MRADGEVGVRAATPADLPAVLAVGRQAFRDTFTSLVGADYAQAGLDRFWSLAAVSAEIDAGWVLVAEATDVVGMASARSAADRTFLSRLYVAQPAQGRGVGRLLLDAVGRRSTGPVTLTVLSTNERARGFYQRNGFRDNGFRRDPDGGPDHLKMERPGSTPPRSYSYGSSGWEISRTTLAASTGSSPAAAL